MKASLDTNVIIHLYKANLSNILFERFEKLLVYSFIRDTELNNHADVQILKAFDNDVAHGKIELIDDSYLREIRMYENFIKHVNDNRLIYEASDLGEVYAIALARTLGAISVVTDDIKERGPHYFLLREVDSDILPFAFYELMLLDFIEGKITPEDFVKQFNLVNDLLTNRMNMESKIKSFVRRFWISPYTDRDKRWINGFCDQLRIVPKQRLAALNEYMEKNKG
jgi:hypothetical protein